MFVVRPKHIKTTPSKVAAALGCQTRYYPQPRMFDYDQDFLMVGVAPNHIQHAPADYFKAWEFFAKNKYGQRKSLEKENVPVPRSGFVHGWCNFEHTGLRFVVRPLRHSGGLHYRITDAPDDFTPGSEYISEFYPKKREYRVIFVFGKPLIWMRKKPNEGVGNDQPWGHTNSVFQTIVDISSGKLYNTDFLAKVSKHPAVAFSHIVAADVLYTGEQERPYVVLELNACPGLDIEGNFQKVITAIQHRHDPQPVIKTWKYTVTKTGMFTGTAEEFTSAMAELNSQGTLSWEEQP